MKKQERFDFIETFLKNDGVHATVDVLHRDFVDRYIDATNAKFYAMPYGAHKCPQLGRDLSEMYAAGRLRRWTLGLDGMSGYGFPRWVYVYRLPL